jgi:hypothetical protein
VVVVPDPARVGEDTVHEDIVVADTTSASG